MGIWCCIRQSLVVDCSLRSGMATSGKRPALERAARVSGVHGDWVLRCVKVAACAVARPPCRNAKQLSSAHARVSAVYAIKRLLLVLLMLCL
jgi:invasion protein IalB